jgi:two-component system phosphate regulon sensor histidine kinase PhoR
VFRGVRGLLFLSSFALVLAGVLVLGLYLNRVERRNVHELLLAEELREARLAAALAPLAAVRREDRRTLDAWADRVGDSIGRRVTIVARGGGVLGDSEVPADGLASLENHSGRPEVRAALAGREGTDVRRSGSVGREYVYAAVPLRDGTEIAGVVRLANPAREAAHAWRRGLRILWAGGAFALLVGAVLSALAAHVFTRRLREISVVADRLGEGDLSLRAPSGGPAEITRLAAALNAMASKLRARIDEVHAERNHLLTLVETLEAGVVVVTRRGRVALANRSFLATLGDGREARGRPLAEVARHFSLHDLVRRAFDSRATVRDEISFLSPEPRHFGATAIPIPDPGGEAAEVLVVLTDLTEFRRLEALRRDFVANVSHELRTPLTAIQGFAETLLDGALDDVGERRNFVERIHAQAERLEAMVEDLLSLARLERPETEFETALVDLPALAAGVLDEFETEARKRGIALRSEFAPDLPAVSGDARRLEEALRNLLDNALKYTPAGSVVVRATRRDGEIEVVVRDTGIGIPEADLPRVFERFYRVGKDRSRETGGTGLGLAIVKHIVERHGGRVRAESDADGTSIYFTLPVAGDPPVPGR